MYASFNLYLYGYFSFRQLVVCLAANDHLGRQLGEPPSVVGWKPYDHEPPGKHRIGGWLFQILDTSKVSSQSAKCLAGIRVLMDMMDG